MSNSNAVTIDNIDRHTVGSLAQLAPEELANLNDDIDTLAGRVKAMRDMLHQAAKEKFQPTFEGGTGTVRESHDTDAGKIDFVFTVPQKVDWSNDKLATVESEADQWGKPLWSYMKVKRTVSEATYKELDAATREKFEPARTVKPGSMTVKIERKKT